MAILGKCEDGLLDPSSSSNAPIPFIGLYIAVATLVCFFCMTFDLVYGSFFRKKPFLPCKLFPMNAFTLTVLAVATKIPNDLITQMPRVEDQLSKLTGTALLCTSLGFYMPSLGSLETSERYGNLAALSVTVITVVVNVSVQIHTGVIFAFTTEHIIIMVCNIVLLLLMWSSAIAFREKKEYERSVARLILRDSRENVRNIDGLSGLVQSAYKLIYRGNGQTLLCKIPNHHTFGLLCVLSLGVVSYSMLKVFGLKSMKTCSSIPSDYQWSIPILVWIQFLTIVVGSVPIILRWLSLVRHFGISSLNLRHFSKSALSVRHFCKFSLTVGCPQLELEYLKLKTLPDKFLNRKIPHFLSVAKDFIINVLIWAQIILYHCNIIFVVLPIWCVKILLESIIHCMFTEEDSTDSWTYGMFKKEMESYGKSCKKDELKELINLINSTLDKMRDGRPGLREGYPPEGTDFFASECASFVKELEITGKKLNIDVKFEDYRYSCISVLVFSRILAKLMPSSRGESLIQSLKESFEIISFVDTKTHSPPSEDDERIWTSSKELWAHWENRSHWFRTKIISRMYKDLMLKEVDDLEVLKRTLDAIQTDFEENKYSVWERANRDSLTEKHRALVSIEFVIICKFIREQKIDSVDELFNFLEMCFIKMLCFTLFDLPLAILRELDGEDPYEIGEGRIRKAFKFCSKLKILLEKMKWLWPAAKVGHTDASAMSLLEFGYNEIDECQRL